jgi:methylglyoxal synthase
MNIGLVAHDHRKEALCQWSEAHQQQLKTATVYATGTTGQRLKERCPELTIHALKSGPLGGDQQLGAMVCEGLLDVLIFFIDPLSPHPHDVDVKALIRLATLYDIPHACNLSTANIIMASLDALPTPKPLHR